MKPLLPLSRRRTAFLVAALLAIGNLAIAQDSVSKHRPDPLDGRLAVSPLIYVSPLKNYHPFIDQEVAPWKESNDNTARVGGWRVYAKQAREPDATEVKPPVKDAPASDKMKSMDHMERTK